jgi:hypothetical protein
MFLISDIYQLQMVGEHIRLSNVYSNAIGYVTSNFIGQLKLQVKVNFMFYHVGNSEYWFEVTHSKYYY